jgi:glycerophosphoryl diester phosphodiesterase
VHKIEEFVASKSGRATDCEDALAFTDHFACVADGATSQTDRLWGGATGGQLAARAVCSAVGSLSPDANAIRAVDEMTSAIARVYQKHDVYEAMRREPLERATAAVAIFSRQRREIWVVGDCQGMIILRDGTTSVFSNGKQVDAINAAARALFLESEIRYGKTIDDLRASDTGREFIKPLLKRQRVFQNPQESSQFSYWVIDGFPVDASGFKVVEVPDAASHLVLASDGYPKLFATLQETEGYLREHLRADPLLIGEHKSTKGVTHGNESYDDRAYLKVQIGVV